ncbi:hypothetical protein ACFY12_15065 [Streptomyces sp. NPDC001339]|uniref:hypothetical protein n=1 Tax=Streptomyces sp. NPDC001339 TaxID=3364563 RepID=UPI00368DF48D
MNKLRQRAVTYVLAPAVMAGGIMTLGAGVASADDGAPTARSTQAPMVNPIEEERSMCTAYNDENACAALMTNTKMMDIVKNCLVKAAIGGATALVVGKYVSKDAAEKISEKVVSGGVTGCLTSLGT